VITIDNVMDSISDFLWVATGTNSDTLQIVRGYGNYVPQPQKEFIVLTELSVTDICFTLTQWDDTNQQNTYTAFFIINVQIDLIGPDSGEWQSQIRGLWRTEVCTNSFPDHNIRPLYLKNAHMNPIMQSSKQNETRWTFDAAIQYNAVITIPAQSANTLSVNIFRGVA